MDNGEHADGSAKKRVSDGERVSADGVSWIYYADAALQLGLSVAETDGFTPGMVTDLAIQRMNQQGSDESQKAGQAPHAGQADYDNF